MKTPAWFLVLASWLIVAFGQPAWVPPLSLVAAAVGYALFWHAAMGRFWLGTFWFAAVQLVQLSWMLSHPFLYIVPVYLLLSFFLGLPFGLLTYLLRPHHLRSLPALLGLAGLATLFEWARLFIFSGLSWNPAGLALTGSLLPLQLAALFGIYGLTFWVFFTNLLALRALRLHTYTLWLAVLAFPYLFGALHLAYHGKLPAPSMNALLVQTAFPTEETHPFQTYDEALHFVTGEWQSILTLLKPFQNAPTDLIVLPEYVVPFNTYDPFYPVDTVREVFTATFGPGSLDAFPPLEEPLAQTLEGAPFVSNAYWVQALSNLFDADVVVGLGDCDDRYSNPPQTYAAAFLFAPGGMAGQRYEKRILVPLGEYIPLACLHGLAAKYGILGSFAPGKEAKVLQGKTVPLGLSVCYEETFSDLMRENRQKGADVLVNVTSDVWFPGSRLMQQHWDHARVRTVEGGYPLVRACNTGITGVIDSLGREVAMLGDGAAESEWLAAALPVKVPLYTYRTLYTRWGDGPVIAFSCFALLGFFFYRKR